MRGSLTQAGEFVNTYRIIFYPNEPFYFLGNSAHSLGPGRLSSIPLRGGIPSVALCWAYKRRFRLRECNILPNTKSALRGLKTPNRGHSRFNRFPALFLGLTVWRWRLLPWLPAGAGLVFHFIMYKGDFSPLWRGWPEIPAIAKYGEKSPQNPEILKKNRPPQRWGRGERVKSDSPAETKVESRKSVLFY